MSLVLVTAPASEPITLAQAKVQVRVESSVTAEDDHITALIQSAREEAEHELGRALIAQTWDLKIDAFPSVEVELPKPVVSSITSISYVDLDGNTQTIASNQYTLDSSTMPGFVLPAQDVDWPDTLDCANAVTVRFVAGWANAAAVPASIKQWILWRVGVLYKHRDTPLPEDRYTRGLLDPWRVYGV